MPKETFETVCEQIREKYHMEIELRCRRPSAKMAPQIQIGLLNTGSIYSAGQAGAMGPHAYASEMSFDQVCAREFSLMDMRALARELASLRLAMRERAVDPEQDIAIGNIAAAEAAAKQGDASSVARLLKGVGTWSLEVATKIGVSVASKAIEKSMGL